MSVGVRAGKGLHPALKWGLMARALESAGRSDDRNQWLCYLRGFRTHSLAGHIGKDPGYPNSPPWRSAESSAADGSRNWSHRRFVSANPGLDQCLRSSSITEDWNVRATHDSGPTHGASPERYYDRLSFRTGCRIAQGALTLDRYRASNLKIQEITTGAWRFGSPTLPCLPWHRIQRGSV